MGEVNSVAAPFAGEDQLVLGAVVCALMIFVWVCRKRRRDPGQEVRGAILRERARIARELHDVVAHHLTVMIASASAAKRQLTLDGANLTLGVIETVGRDGLVEMRRLLGRLRIEEETGSPGLDQLPTLVARVELAGLPVRLTVRGDRRPLPDNVDVNAYRIVQEALTNALRHAGPTRARVVVGYLPEWLRLRIFDFGVGGGAGSDGYGVDGIRQRVARLGGAIAVGPGPGGGFQVAVDLPVKQPVAIATNRHLLCGRLRVEWAYRERGRRGRRSGRGQISR
ncbi:MAG: sensor histidine kinase [Labedaea sp.]